MANISLKSQQGSWAGGMGEKFAGRQAPATPPSVLPPRERLGQSMWRRNSPTLSSMSTSTSTPSPSRSSSKESSSTPSGRGRSSWPASLKDSIGSRAWSRGSSVAMGSSRSATVGGSCRSSWRSSSKASSSTQDSLGAVGFVSISPCTGFPPRTNCATFQESEFSQLVRSTEELDAEFDKIFDSMSADASVQQANEIFHKAEVSTCMRDECFMQKTYADHIDEMQVKQLPGQVPLPDSGPHAEAEREVRRAAGGSVVLTGGSGASQAQRSTAASSSSMSPEAKCHRCRSIFEPGNKFCEVCGSKRPSASSTLPALSPCSAPSHKYIDALEAMDKRNMDTLEQCASSVRSDGAITPSMGTCESLPAASHRSGPATSASLSNALERLKSRVAEAKNLSTYVENLNTFDKELGRSRVAGMQPSRTT